LHGFRDPYDHMVFHYHGEKGCSRGKSTGRRRCMSIDIGKDIL
jgi:hypothetical protein